MRKMLLLGLVALTGCGLNQPENLVLMPVKVTLPVSVAATADLAVVMQGTEGCIAHKKTELSLRSASVLSLTVYGSKQANCTAPVSLNTTTTEVIFVDSAEYGGKRLDPFEVWVNGVKVGTVAVR